MTLLQFDQMLKAVCPQTYELNAPKDTRRFVVWHRYGAQSAQGDDQNTAVLPKVQLDICIQSTRDSLVEDICSALDEAYIPYSVQELYRYDPDYMALRTILQMVVV